MSLILICPYCKKHIVPSEDLVYCPHCAQMLPNSFQKCKRVRPLLNYDTYLLENCIPQSMTGLVHILDQFRRFMYWIFGIGKKKLESGKHFLKCENCGKYAEIVSENTQYCSYCSNKLKNHFKQWFARNPDKDFQYYLTYCCESDADMLFHKRLVRLSKVVKVGCSVFLVLFIAMLIQDWSSLFPELLQDKQKVELEPIYLKELSAMVYIPEGSKEEMAVDTLITDSLGMTRKVIYKQWTGQKNIDFYAVRIDYPVSLDTVGWNDRSWQLFQRMLPINLRDAQYFLEDSFIKKVSGVAYSGTAGKYDDPIFILEQTAIRDSTVWGFVATHSAEDNSNIIYELIQKIEVW